MKKRLLSILLALAIVGGLLTAFAAVASSSQANNPPVCAVCGKALSNGGYDRGACYWVCNNPDCSNVGVTITKNHQLTNPQIIKAPTCDSEGYEEATCELCGQKIGAPIHPLGHMVFPDPGVNPTCTKPGKTEGSHCDVCGKVIVAQKDIPALGHDYKTQKITVKPTCTTDGEGVAVCTRCGSRKTVVIKARHNYFNMPLAGRTFSVCSECGDVKVKLSNTRAKNAAEKNRQIIDELIWDNIEEFNGDKIDNDTKFKIIEVGEGVFQLCIDKADRGSSTPKLFKLPIFAILPGTLNKDKPVASKPDKFEVPLEGLNIKDLDSTMVFFITDKDEYEKPDGKIVGDSYVFEVNKAGFLVALKDDSITAKAAEAGTK